MHNNRITSVTRIVTITWMMHYLLFTKEQIFNDIKRVHLGMTSFQWCIQIVYLVHPKGTSHFFLNIGSKINGMAQIKNGSKGKHKLCIFLPFPFHFPSSAIKLMIATVSHCYANVDIRLECNY